MSVRNKVSWIAIVSFLAALVGSCYFIVHHAAPDPFWNLPLTKGDLYLCTALLIMFGRGK